MADVNPELVEKYQLMLQSDPRAKVFAPLAEAYRKMGLIEEGIQLCQKGIEYHPDFAGGRVALGRLYLDRGDLVRAAEQLAKATDLSPENLLAQSLLGDVYLKLRRPKEALAAYKMLLFLSPRDGRAQAMVKKLESLTADEYEEDLFTMTKLTSVKDRELTVETPTPLKPLSPADDAERARRDLERHLSLADAFLVRNDFEKAQQTLENAEKIHGPSHEIERRLKLLNQRFLDDSNAGEEIAPPPSRGVVAREQQLSLLKELQDRIALRRRNP